MGRKREKEIVSGSNINVRIPDYLEKEVIEFLNSQDNLTRFFLELTRQHVFKVKTIFQ